MTCISWTASMARRRFCARRRKTSTRTTMKQKPPTAGPAQRATLASQKLIDEPRVIDGGSVGAGSAAAPSTTMVVFVSPDDRSALAVSTSHDADVVALICDAALCRNDSDTSDTLTMTVTSSRDAAAAPVGASSSTLSCDAATPSRRARSKMTAARTVTLRSWLRSAMELRVSVTITVVPFVFVELARVVTVAVIAVTAAVELGARDVEAVVVVVVVDAEVVAAAVAVVVVTFVPSLELVS